MALLLLDINMPVMGGHETLIEVKKMFKEFNQSNRAKKLLRPMICYLSQADFKVMNQFMTAEEEAEIYLEKPLPVVDLKSLMKLNNLI